MAFVQPDRRLLSLPAPTGRAGAVPVLLPHAGGLSPPALGPADRRRVPQPDALPLRRRQRALQDAPAGGAPVRAPPVSLRHAAQRPHPLLHRPAGDAGPRALHPHQRDGSGHAAAGGRRGGPPTETGHQREERLAPVLHPPSAEVPDPGCRSTRGPALHRLRHFSRFGALVRFDGNEAETACRNFRGGDPGQTAALLPHRVRRVLEPGKTGLLRPRRCGRIRVGRRRTPSAAGNRRRPGSPAAPGHRRNRRGGLAPEFRRRRYGGDPRHRKSPPRAWVSPSTARPSPTRTPLPTPASTPWWDSWTGCCAPRAGSGTASA